MNYRTFNVLLSCLLFGNTPLFSQHHRRPPTPIEVLRDSLVHVPYVFEAEIYNAELFIANARGREVKNLVVRWQDSIGIIPGIGNSYFPFVRAEIKVMHTYKGELPTKRQIKVLNKIGIFDRVWFQVDATGDTIVMYKLKETKSAFDKINLLIPFPNISSRRLFFCRRIDQVGSNANKGKMRHSSFDVFLQFPLSRETVSLTLDTNARTALSPLFFFRDSELVELLNQLERKKNSQK